MGVRDVEQNVTPHGWLDYAQTMIDARNEMNNRMYRGDQSPWSRTGKAAARVRAVVSTTIRAYATGARTGVPYHLVLGNDGGEPLHPNHACMNTADILNPTPVFAGPSGLIGMTTGIVHEGTPIGRYQLCFKDSRPANTTGTGGASFFLT